MTAASTEPAPEPVVRDADVVRGPEASPPTQFASVDVLRATGIAAVVFIHAIDNPRNAVELYALHLTRFAVPLFFALSGWAEGRGTAGKARRTWRRLGRILPPYFVAATLAELYTAWRGPVRSAREIVQDYLLGTSFGQYYFVFLLTGMTLLSPWFARLQRKTLLLMWLAIVGSRLLLLVAFTLQPGSGTIDLFWVLHDPSHAAQYFLAGWLIHLYREPLGALLRKHGAALLGATTALAAVLSLIAPLDEPRFVAFIAGYLNTFLVGAVIALAARHVEHVPAPVRFVSRASYSFYLYHLFFVFEAMRVLPDAAPFWVLTWCAGMLGPWLVVAGSRRVLGERARTWVGA